MTGLEVSDIFRYKKNQSDLENYIRWLCDDVGLDYGRYSEVASTLLLYVFDDHVKNDINRTWDAIANREDFEKEYDIMLDLHDEDHAGWLEVMVVLARRAADVMYDAYEDDQTEYYFDVMFRNLGLEKFDDDHFNHLKVVQILQKLDERKYDDHGKGGLFRLKCARPNIQDAEIWSQMNWYLTEKWGQNY